MEKDGITRIFVQAGASGKVYEGYPEDNMRDESKWIPEEEVMARGDVSLTTRTWERTTWIVHPVYGGNPLPRRLKEHDQFVTDRFDAEAAANELTRRVGKTGLTVITA